MVVKHRISEEEKRKISEAIREIERQSSAEIVTVITPKSDDYIFIPILWAALGALAVPAITMAAGLMLEPALAYGLQLIVFLLLVLIGRIEPVTMALTPASIKKARAVNAARSHFVALKLHSTKKRSGLMLFVSKAEHYVEILADIEIAKKIPDSAWEAIVQAFIARVKVGQIAQGYLEAIQSIGKLLIPHFPRDPDDTDELPNHLIVLEPSG